MVIISDTSPITNLIQIEQLQLLKLLFGKVIIPTKVYEELIFIENQRTVIDAQDWIIIQQIESTYLTESLNDKLDDGEVEAIILAQELKADFLIIDERKGRKIAESYGLRIIGLLGILIRAKQSGFLNELKPVVDKLISEVGFFVNRKLYDHVLMIVGENEKF